MDGNKISACSHENFILLNPHKCLFTWLETETLLVFCYASLKASSLAAV